MQDSALEVELQQRFLPTAHTAKSYCFTAVLTVLVLCFTTAAAGFSIHVGMKVLGAASQVQNALQNLQTILAVFYTFACKNETLDIFTPEDCQRLCTVINCSS